VDRDDCIFRLVETMDDVYSFVKEAEPIKKVESNGQIVALIAQQTTECAYFIRDYMTNKSFCRSASLFHVEESNRYLHHQGKESSKIVSFLTLIARSQNTMTSSSSSKWLFSLALFSRLESLSHAY
jgi:hypothetical protein